jgi:hypothetical protein
MNCVLRDILYLNRGSSFGASCSEQGYICNLTPETEGIHINECSFIINSTAYEIIYEKILKVKYGNVKLKLCKSPQGEYFVNIFSNGNTECTKGELVREKAYIQNQKILDYTQYYDTGYQPLIDKNTIAKSAALQQTQEIAAAKAIKRKSAELVTQRDKKRSRTALPEIGTRVKSNEKNPFYGTVVNRSNIKEDDGTLRENIHIYWDVKDFTEEDTCKGLTQEECVGSSCTWVKQGKGGYCKSKKKSANKEEDTVNADEWDEKISKGEWVVITNEEYFRGDKEDIVFDISSDDEDTWIYLALLSQLDAIKDFINSGIHKNLGISDEYKNKEFNIIKSNITKLLKELPEQSSFLKDFEDAIKPARKDTVPDLTRAYQLLDDKLGINQQFPLKIMEDLFPGINTYADSAEHAFITYLLHHLNTPELAKKIKKESERYISDLSRDKIGKKVFEIINWVSFDTPTTPTIAWIEAPLSVDKFKPIMNRVKKIAKVGKLHGFMSPSLKLDSAGEQLFNLEMNGQPMMYDYLRDMELNPGDRQKIIIKDGKKVLLEYIIERIQNKFVENKA